MCWGSQLWPFGRAGSPTCVGATTSRFLRPPPFPRDCRPAGWEGGRRGRASWRCCPPGAVTSRVFFFAFLLFCSFTSAKRLKRTACAAAARAGRPRLPQQRPRSGLKSNFVCWHPPKPPMPSLALIKGLSAQFEHKHAEKQLLHEQAEGNMYLQRLLHYAIPYGVETGASSVSK